MLKHELKLLYKQETGSFPEEIEHEFSIYRSKGQWYIDLDDEDAMYYLSYETIDPDYITWLEETPKYQII